MAKGKPADPLDPNFLIEHAERLTTSEGSGRPYTVDSRRAASTACYAAYHAATGAVARFLFGENWLAGVRWLSHRAVIDAARLVSRLGPASAPDPGVDPDRVRERAIWSIFQGAGGAKDDLLDAIETLRSLKVEREIADYDRTQTVPRATARNLVDQAEAVKKFFESDRTGDRDTQVFLALAALKA
jgi:hypothetical protein